MRYASGKDVRLGDSVQVGTTGNGTVVACLESGHYSPAYPAEEWSYLQNGVLILTDFGGLVHYSRLDDEPVTLVSRTPTSD